MYQLADELRAKRIGAVETKGQRFLQVFLPREFRITAEDFTHLSHFFGTNARPSGYGNTLEAPLFAEHGPGAEILVRATFPPARFRDRSEEEVKNRVILAVRNNSPAERLTPEQRQTLARFIDELLSKAGPGP